MIGGLNPASYSQIQSGNNAPARERTDTARASAAAPMSVAVDSARKDLGNPAQSRDGAPQTGNATESPEATARRVEARRAAEDVRLESFRADDVSPSAARALSTFAGVAAAGQEYEGGSVLSGIDIMV
ncbi:hypothetical protein SAMN05216429_10631 [Marinobacter persicus]|uniref:UDP pyrophosphate phosphatase n=1 Tax=Marinobacter persicus TaxID=930118 RepID=A0A1I3UDK7_9GAMM|nr:UDP pyrophosphate phosphatase [Marinobacter persicus]GHD40103.1 hypothetical protein GCM10008110_00660 [Marinobacter persicus]SFJ79867.1 hypothetical protein SAMN05216429_10631 [Marinobacter persicus]